MESTYFTNQAIDFLSRPHSKPFALVVGYYDPHAPFHFPREWENRFRPEQFQMPLVQESDRATLPKTFATLTKSEGRGIQAAYYTSLSFLDHQVGRLLNALDSTGLRRRTLVIYLGDNGYLLGQHGRFEKHCMYEPAVRVPLIMSWPGRIPEGRQIMGQVELVDLLPTIYDMLKVPHPAVLHGESLVGLVAGDPNATGRDVVFSEYLENEEAMVRSARYKLIVGSGRRRRKDGYQTSRAAWGPYEHLYDMKADPEELNDLSNLLAYQKIQNELRAKLYHRLVTTREGLIPIPSGLTESEAIHWCLIPRDGEL